MLVIDADTVLERDALSRAVLPFLEDTRTIGVPANPLLIVDAPHVFDALARIRLVVVAVLIALLGAVLIRRWRAASPSQHRALAPVYLAGSDRHRLVVGRREQKRWRRLRRHVHLG